MRYSFAQLIDILLELTATSMPVLLGMQSRKYEIMDTIINIMLANEGLRWYPKMNLNALKELLRLYK